jgi:FkbM family methyltransferase
MHRVERWCIGLRHSASLKRLEWLWNLVRPAYNAAVARVASRGLSRVINGTDQMLVVPELRGIAETYEPHVWPRVMSEIRRADTIIDVGAHVGLYTVAFGKRVGPEGRVIAFEPDPENFELLRQQISLNNLDGLVEPRQVAVADHDGLTQFAVGRSVESHIVTEGGNGVSIEGCRLDSVYSDSRIDIVKIDVEGFEEKVLRGAEKLLSDEERKPRVMFIEVHPYNWHLCGTTTESLIYRLKRCGYEVYDLQNEPVSKIDRYGEVVARLV